ncbi:uncharacterized protein Dana_GF10132, isoform C [Drosophila ananassae]|uniref:Protein Smaug n=1 Tax=Drosophila ananassae TaxID=7217 RepID=A0A0P8XTT1_DROAN|nr:protein Smaug isoform X1 [Drosophila ananassae]XP_014764178.1 protein Smaug isoform X1 [Drosophila ananassae]KPU78127.1 uncharacterized protein Dana_GF10132, isoform B [Drosophila ananassae]KPU78128.1 uncharacterized protein Dana_GF10132, isoform C [Drosophila ananassae]
MKYPTGTTENPMSAGIPNSASIEMQPTTSSSTTTSTPKPERTATTSSPPATTTTDNNPNPNASQASNALFCEQVTTVTNLFEKWNDCERTVVMYALLKRLRYPSLKFLQYSIDSTLTQNLGTSQTNLSSVVIDINANNPVYLQNLLNAYKTFQPCDLLDAMSSSSSDKDSMPCYGSDFQITTSAQCDERKLFARKEDILNEVLNMLPLLKPGNEEAKVIYLTLIPVAVKDTMQQIVPTELVQQIFSYLLIHPAISSEDRRSLNIWLRHLEDHIQAAAAGLTNRSYFLQPSPQLVVGGSSTGSGSCSSSSATSSSTASCSSVTSGSRSSRTNDWQTIAPPSKHLQHKLSDWRGSGSSGSINPLCDNLNGITRNELASSQTQNSLGLTLDSTSSLVNGVVAGAAAGSMLGIAGGGHSGDDHDTSFSKNGTEILDFDPTTADVGEACSLASSSNLCGAPDTNPQQQLLQPPPYASILMGDQFGDINRWSLDSKIAALKTRRSNSLTTQTISSCSSSSNSSVITVNDNCSNSTENLAQFANKPRSFSLSIEHQRGVLANSGSDTRLDEFKPNYIRFHTRNVGMSGIGLWLKSLRLHKYIELFKNMTYEEMLLITEDFLQSVGVTKGASHKLALCIEKLKERANILKRVEQDLVTGQMKLSTAVEELTNIVLTPMKPLDALGPPEENIGLRFLKVIDIVSNTLQQDPYAAQDDETLGVFMWILDRSIHNEAFMNHANQLKELKFKLSKLKSSLPKLHHVKAAGGGVNGGNINKPRWNGKTRKCDTKNGSNDRINNRKNSNDMLNFSLNCLQHPQLPHHPQQGPPPPLPLPQFDYNGYNSGPSHQPQYKSSSYPSFMGNPQQQQQQQQQPQPPKSHHHGQQQQQMQQMLQQHNHFPALPQQTPPQQAQPHRRSLNNLILVAGGPQQPQQLIFKPGQGVLTNNGSNDNLLTQQQQPRKLSGGVASSEQQPKKTMAAVVMVSNPSQSQEQIGSNNNNNNSMLNNNLINQQQLQLLAAAVASCPSTSTSTSVGGGGIVSGLTGGACGHNLCHQSSKNNNHAVDHCLGMMNDFKSLEQLETLCRQMTEQAMN